MSEKKNFGTLEAQHQNIKITTSALARDLKAAMMQAARSRGTLPTAEDVELLVLTTLAYLPVKWFQDPEIGLGSWIPSEATPEMERAFRSAFIEQIHRRRNLAGRNKNPLSAESAGLRAMLKVAPKPPYCNCEPTQCNGEGNTRCRWHLMGYTPTQKPPEDSNV